MEYYSDSPSDSTLGADGEMATQRPPSKNTIRYDPSNKLDKKIASTKPIDFKPTVSKLTVSNLDAEMVAQQAHSQLTSPKLGRKRKRKSKCSKTNPATPVSGLVIQPLELAKLPNFENDAVNSEHHSEHKKKAQFENSNPHHIRFESPERVASTIKTTINKEVSDSPPRRLNISSKKANKTEFLTTHLHTFKSPTPEMMQPSHKATTDDTIKSAPLKHMRINVEDWIGNDIGTSEAEDIVTCGSSHANLKIPSPEKTKLSGPVTMNNKLRRVYLSNKSMANEETTDESEVEETIISASARAALGLQKQISTRLTSRNKVSQKRPRFKFSTHSKGLSDKNTTNFDFSDESSSSCSSSASSDGEFLPKILNRSRGAKLYGQPNGANSFNESNLSSKASFFCDTKKRNRKTLKKGPRMSTHKILVKPRTAHGSTSSFDSYSDDEQLSRKRSRRDNQASRPFVTSPLQELLPPSPSRVCPQKLKWLKENVMRAQVDGGSGFKKHNDMIGDKISNEELINEESTGTSSSESDSSSSDNSRLQHRKKLQMKQTISASATVFLGNDRVSPQKLKWLKKNVMMAQVEDYIKQESEESSRNDDPESYDEMSDEDHTSGESESSYERPITVPLTRRMLRPRTHPRQSPLLISPHLQPRRQAQRQPEPEKRHPTQPGFPPLSQLPASLPTHIKEIYTRERHGGQLTYKELNTLTHHLTLLQLRLRRRSKSYLKSGHSAFLLRKILRNKKRLTTGLRAHREKQYEYWRKRAGRKWKKLEEVRGVVKVLERTVEVEWGREGMMWRSKG